MNTTLKKIIAVAFAALAVFAAGCSKPAPKPTPEELTELYLNAIESARSDEENESTPAITTPNDAEAEMVFPLISFNPENAEAFAVSISPWNISAYGIAVIMPKEDKKEEVLNGVKAFVENQQKAFENYLPDQYRNAENAIVDTLRDGTIILVMCPNESDVFNSIIKTISDGQK